MTNLTIPTQLDGRKSTVQGCCTLKLSKSYTFWSLNYLQDVMFLKFSQFFFLNCLSVVSTT